MPRRVSILNRLTGQRVRLTVKMFGRTTVMAGKLINYSKPFLAVQTREGTRLLNEYTIQEMIPLDTTVVELMQLVA